MGRVAAGDEGRFSVQGPGRTEDLAGMAGRAENIAAMAMLADYGSDDGDAVLEEEAATLAGSAPAEAGVAGVELVEAEATGAAVDAGGGGCAAAATAAVAAAVAAAATTAATAATAAAAAAAALNAAAPSTAAATSRVKDEGEAETEDVGEDCPAKPPLTGGLREPRSEADLCELSDAEWFPVLPEKVSRSRCLLCPLKNHRQLSR
jgi:hypothetical protein